VRLAVFDIDGTLTDTCAVDTECYLEALAEVFGLPSELVRAEWRLYPHVTDSGIAATAVERHLRRQVEPAELARLESVFVGRLAAELRRAPERCRPIPGARELVAELAAKEDWMVALATGGFRQSALLKLALAGFDPPPILATAAEAPSRAEITRHALRAAREMLGGGFESAVLVGDAPWDVAAGRELGLPCVGVARGEAAQEMARAGAVALLADYSDRDGSLAVIAAAAEVGIAVRD
jgi:phosphoglycolate phosphatase-like HAD superfamily hydrolase